ncbi:MAG TPA: portal protein [Chthonomonadales bacterium]|nr:portal protein [Chthonomonadales bacterium]
MADSRATDILDKHERMRQQRVYFEKVWQDIADRIIPRKADFKRQRGKINEPKGERRTEKIFDAAPALALDRFAAAMHSLVTPRNQQWHSLRPMQPALAEDDEVKGYLEEVNKILFSARYSANFDNQVHECYFDSGAFGNMAMFIGDRLGRSLYYRTVPIDQLFFMENEYGQVDLVHREFPMTARQAAQKFGLDRLPMPIKDAAEKRPEQEFWFVHCVKPREDADVSRKDYRGMAFASYFIAVDSREIVGEGGYRSFPYAVSRYAVTSGEVYGRGPAQLILPDVMMLNEMNRTTIQAAQLAVLPPLLAHRDGILDAIRMTPAAINYGGVDDNGRQMIQPLTTGSRPEIGLELMDQKRALINDAFWNTLFQILVDTPSMTATEAMLRAQEKGALLAPTASRIEAEFLSPMVEREIDILAAAGVLPPMPDALMEAGGLFEVEYTSPLERARRAEEGVSILRTFEQLAPLAQIAGPTVFKRFNFDEAAKVLADVNGVPAKIMYSDEEMEEINAQEAQQAELASILQAAPVAASAAKDLAGAQALANASPNEMMSAA